MDIRPIDLIERRIARTAFVAAVAGPFSIDRTELGVGGANAGENDEADETQTLGQGFGSECCIVSWRSIFDWSSFCSPALWPQLIAGRFWGHLQRHQLIRLRRTTLQSAPPWCSIERKAINTES